MFGDRVMIGDGQHEVAVLVKRKVCP